MADLRPCFSLDKNEVLLTMVRIYKVLLFSCKTKTRSDKVSDMSETLINACPCDTSVSVK